MFKSINKDFFEITIIETEFEIMIMTNNKHCKMCGNLLDKSKETTKMNNFFQRYLDTEKCAKTYSRTNQRLLED